MAEYQYYEFLALDKPLTDKQMAEVRQFSTRARITATSFVNEYHWGDFRGDIDHFIRKYYDAFVYFANWGTRELRFRLPKAALDIGLAERYCRSDGASLRLTGEYAVLTLSAGDEGGDDDCDMDDGWMSSLAPLRADLLAGDLRCLYLGWLHCAGCGELDEEEMEPPVPLGLGNLTAPLQALADFLWLDEALIEAAAEASRPLTELSEFGGELRSWVESLPVQEKDSLLYRLTQESSAVVQRDILRRFREERRTQSPICRDGERTVRQLLDAGSRRVEERERLAAEKRAKEEARKREEAAKASQKHLDALARREAHAWQEVEALIQTRQPKKYDEAVQLLRDLRDLAEREGRADEAAGRVAALRAAHTGKPSLLRRLDEAKL